MERKTIVSVNYGVFIKDLKDSLKTTIDGTTSFSGKTHADYADSVDYNPNARIELDRDDFDDSGPVVSLHWATFLVKVRYLAGVAESDMNLMMGYVGEIVDAIEADRTLGSSYVLRSEVKSTEWSIQVDRNTQGIIRHCHITVLVESIRNA